jgi:MFS family permease
MGGGEIMDRVHNPNIIILLCVSTVALCNALVQFCTTFPLLTILFVGQGLAMGLIDTSANVLVLKYWAADSGPWLQALHFSFAFGGFLVCVRLLCVL